VNKDKLFFFLKQQRKDGLVCFFFYNTALNTPTPISELKGEISSRRPN